MDPRGYTAESIALATAPKIPALLSIAGSLFIIWSVLKREKKNSIYQRLMLGISLSDIFASHIYFVGTWVIPKGSSGPFGDVYMAFGTDATCSYSGFFNQLAVASPFYNVSLSIYFLLRIQKGWRDRALKKIEPLFHLVPIAFAIGTSVTALLGDMYGNVFWTCWINPDPPQKNFEYFQWAFLFGPVWLCIIIQIVVMVTLWWTLRKQEQLISRKYDLEEPAKLPTSDDGKNESSNDSIFVDLDESARSGASNSTRGKRKRNRASINENSKNSTRIAVQGSLYVLAFLIIWLFPTVQRITELTVGINYFAVQVLDTTLLPLQGFFNVLIYIRPRYLHCRRKYPDLPSVAIWKMLRRPKEELKLARMYRRERIETKIPTRTLQQQTTGNNNKEQSPTDIEKEQGALGSILEEIQEDVDLGGSVDGISETSHNTKDSMNDNIDQATNENDTTKDNMKWTGVVSRTQELEESVRQRESEGTSETIGTQLDGDTIGDDNAARTTGEDSTRRSSFAIDTIGDGQTKTVIIREGSMRSLGSSSRIQELQERIRQLEEENTELRLEERVRQLEKENTELKQASSRSLMSSKRSLMEKVEEGAEESPPALTAKQIDMTGRVKAPRSTNET